MSTQDEKYRALQATYDLLEELQTAKRVPEWIREKAKRCMRHWPSKGEIRIGWELTQPQNKGEKDELHSPV